MMKLLTKWSALILILLVCLSAWFLNSKQDSSVIVPEKAHALKGALNTCVDITERAAADLVAIVEFQKLEIAGRKAHVFKACMQDRGFIENSRWLKYSKPLAKELANKTSVSTDAAIEVLRRVDMMLVFGEAARPSYWVRK